MNVSSDESVGGWIPSVYYAESLVDCPIDKAWKIMLDYEAWNPSFVDAEVVPVKGNYRTEGEVVLIKKQINDVTGKPLPEFYAETVKVVPRRHMVGYMHLKDGESIRNFVDFGLSKVGSGVRFNINYYAQDRLSPELIAKQRQEYQVILNDLASAFKKYCESDAKVN